MRDVWLWVPLVFLGACMPVRVPSETNANLAGGLPTATAAAGDDRDLCVSKVGIEWDARPPGAECAQAMARWVARTAVHQSHPLVRVWVLALGPGEPTDSR